MENRNTSYSNVLDFLNLEFSILQMVKENQKNWNELNDFKKILMS